MRKLLNILAVTSLVTTPVITVSCKTREKSAINKYKDKAVEDLPNGPLKSKLQQTTLFTKMVIANRHENLNTYTPSMLQTLMRLPDSFKDKDGNIVDIDYYRSRYLNQKDGMPLTTLVSNYDYIDLLDNKLYNTENQTKRKIPEYSEKDALPKIPNFAQNSNMLNYWYDGGPLSDYSVAKEILPVSQDDNRINKVIGDAYKKAMYEMPRTTYFYDLNMNYNPLKTKNITAASDSTPNFIINNKKFAMEPFKIAQKSEEQDKLFIILKLISMVDMFTDRSQSKAYINQLNKFLPLTKDSDGTFMGSILGAIYYQIFASPNQPSDPNAPNKLYNLVKILIKDALKNLGTTEQQKTDIDNKVEKFFADQAQVFADLLVTKPMQPDLNLTTEEGKYRNRDAMWNGKTPNLRLVDLLFKKDSSSKNLAELFTEFGKYLDGMYQNAGAENQSEANNSISSFLGMAASLVTPGFKSVLKSMSKMLKPKSSGGLGTLTINDINRFIVALSEGILSNSVALQKVSELPWSESENQEQNQTEIAKLLTGSDDPSKPVQGSFMDTAFIWFNDKTKPVRTLLNKIYFDSNSETRKDLLEINTVLYDYAKTLLLGDNWNISNGQLDENKLSYDIEYKGQGDADVADNLYQHRQWYVSKKEINTYEDLNKVYLAAMSDKEKNLEWFEKYNGLGNTYQKVHYKYKVIWKNVNPGDDSHQYWVISNIQWFAKNNNGEWQRYYDAIQND